jgi:hypothetical protein
MRFAASSIDDQRSLVRVAPRVFLIRDGELVRHRQGEQRRQEYAQAFQLGPLKLRVNGLEPAISPLLVAAEQNRHTRSRRCPRTPRNSGRDKSPKYRSTNPRSKCAT